MKLIRIQYLILTFALTSILFSCKSVDKEIQYGKATRELISLVEKDPELKAMFAASIEKARRINPDPDTNPAQTLEEYYNFVSFVETAMPWALQRKSEYREIKDNTFQSLACFYFLIDQPLEELEGRGLFHNSLQYSDQVGNWLVTFSKSWGAYLDTEASWNDDYLELASQDPTYGLQNGWFEDPSAWKTYNQFFTRRLRSPDVRPISSPEDKSVVASFADCTPQGVWDIDGSSNIVDPDGVPVKSATLKNVAELIGADSKYAEAFANGTFTHAFLNTNDYHRYHFPLGGIVKEVRLIRGINPTGGKLWWDVENRRYGFDPSLLGWQTIETRGCVILDTEEYGLVALLPIGMVAVGSVNFKDDIVPGARVRKGDELGHFAFGGSDFIMVFQQQVDFSLDAPLEENNRYYNHILMGERMGHLTQNLPH